MTLGLWERCYFPADQVTTNKAAFRPTVLCYVNQVDNMGKKHTWTDTQVILQYYHYWVLLVVMLQSSLVCLCHSAATASSAKTWSLAVPCQGMMDPAAQEWQVCCISRICQEQIWMCVTRRCMHTLRYMAGRTHQHRQTTSALLQTQVAQTTLFCISFCLWNAIKHLHMKRTLPHPGKQLEVEFSWEAGQAARIRQRA